MKLGDVRRFGGLTLTHLVWFPFSGSGELAGDVMTLCGHSARAGNARPAEFPTCVVCVAVSLRSDPEAIRAERRRLGDSS